LKIFKGSARARRLRPEKQKTDEFLAAEKKKINKRRKKAKASRKARRNK
jgi:hypothetical protein